MYNTFCFQKKKSSINDDSEYETLEEDNIDNDSSGSQNSHQHSRHSSELEDGELSDSFLLEDQREDGDGEEVKCRERVGNIFLFLTDHINIVALPNCSQ